MQEADRRNRPIDEKIDEVHLALKAVRELAGDPDVSLQASVPLIEHITEALFGLEELRAHDFGFSAAEITALKKYVDQFAAANPDAPVLDTVRRMIDLQEKLATFRTLPEELIQRKLAGTNVDYRESGDVKLREFFSSKGFHTFDPTRTRLLTLNGTLTRIYGIKFNDPTEAEIVQQGTIGIGIVERWEERKKRRFGKDEIRAFSKTHYAANLYHPPCRKRIPSGYDLVVDIFSREYLPQIIPVVQECSAMFDKKTSMLLMTSAPPPLVW